MEIVKAKNIGFCNGVDYSIKEALKLLETGDKIYCLGKIVHNDDVLVELENKGLIFIITSLLVFSSNVLFKS